VYGHVSPLIETDRCKRVCTECHRVVYYSKNICKPFAVLGSSSSRTMTCLQRSSPGVLFRFFGSLMSPPTQVYQLLPRGQWECLYSQPLCACTRCIIRVYIRPRQLYTYNIIRPTRYSSFSPRLPGPSLTSGPSRSRLYCPPYCPLYSPLHSSSCPSPRL
jgi:hypothetical protein